MNRRDSIFALLAIGAAPLIVEAQPAKRVPKLAFLNPGTFATNPPSQEFFRALKDLGWIEGQNIVIERREADGDAKLLSRFASELVALRPDLIVTNSTAGATAAQKATHSIPIVMINVTDAVKSGFTANLAHPSGNMTGVATNAAEMNQKRVQLLKEIVPSASRIAMLGNTDNQAVVVLMQDAAQAALVLGLKVESLAFSGADGLNAVLVKPVNAQVLLVSTDAVISSRREVIARFAIAQRLPAIGQYPEEAMDGLLAAYGPSLRANWGKAATYADKILRGAKPSDLPIELPATFELVINLKTAKAIGIKIPPSILVRADQVIE